MHVCASVLGRRSLDLLCTLALPLALSFSSFSSSLSCFSYQESRVESHDERQGKRVSASFLLRLPCCCCCTSSTSLQLKLTSFSLSRERIHSLFLFFFCRRSLCHDVRTRASGAKRLVREREGEKRAGNSILSQCIGHTPRAIRATSFHRRSFVPHSRSHSHSHSHSLVTLFDSTH